MKHWLMLFALLHALPSTASVTDGPDKLFEAGQDHFYNAEYRNATDCFTRYVALRPNDPRGYWRLAYTQYFQWKEREGEMFPRVDPKEKDAFLKLVEIGIQKADAEIAAKRDVDFAKYVKAGLLSMRGGIEFKNVGILTARKTLVEVLKVASESRYQDAKYLVGLTNYNGSNHVWAFRFGGLPHEREAGLEKIYEAFAANHGPFADDIGFALFSIETDPRNAGRYTKEEIERLACELWQKYRRNPTLRKYCDVNTCPLGR